MDDIARLTNKILVLDKGKLAMAGTPAEVFSQADYLESLGLGLPLSAYLMNELRKRRIPVSEGILNIDEAEEELYSILKTY